MLNVYGTFYKNHYIDTIIDMKGSEERWYKCNECPFEIIEDKHKKFTSFII